MVDTGEGVSGHAVSDVPGAIIVPDIADGEPLFKAVAIGEAGSFAATACRVPQQALQSCSVPMLLGTGL